MADKQHDEHTRQAQLRHLEEDRRTRKATEDLRRQQQERQAPDEECQTQTQTRPAEGPNYAELPRPSYTRIR
ncbi:hypothetical protein [Streptomyces botrytidirepellens]|uniref:Uncharacterized protein n=1 Tax=Streptomyces botrytidirepellens TaxID=2486417 RepID=A0A3M8WBE6_9ACTN|nr:hypothetical protein [Streptomyces botrytidirepellens]RNG26039.1 hypothetical protein EEJ42_16345 [Streptomyces botrytidirepellens]